MPQYRVYTLDDAGKFISATDVEAASDAEILELVRLYPDDLGFEVWSRSRRVGQIGRDKVVVLPTELTGVAPRAAAVRRDGLHRLLTGIIKA